MIDIQTISTIVGIFIGLGALIAGSGFAYSQFKSGGDKFKDSLIATLKETIVVLEDKIKKISEEKSQLITSHQIQITKLAGDFGELKGRFDEQAKKVDEYRQLLQGTNPELKDILTEIRDFLKKIDVQSLTNQKRNEVIDQNTKLEEGKVLRKK